MMTSYKIGQIIYVILRKEASVYPMQIIEEQVKRNLEGEHTTYMVQAGGSGKVVAMTDIDGEIFDSSERAKSTLVERVSASIVQRVDNAVAKAREWYPTGFESAPDDPISLVKRPASKATNRRPADAPVEPVSEQPGEGAVIELPDGTKAKLRQVKLPDELKN